MPRVILGHQDGDSWTVVNIPSEDSNADALRNITHQDGLWSAHSTGGDPAWVESDNVELAQAISDHYGCPVGRPGEDS